MRLLSLSFLFSTIALATVQSSYAPAIGVCTNSTSPIRSTVGAVQTLNLDEAAYIKTRLSKVPAALESYMGNLSSVVYGGNLASAAPVIGISISGGGLRAALYGAGVVNALDGRNATAVKAGTGGLLQLASYTAALSGGSWFLSSFVFHDMPTIYELVLGGNTTQGWFLDVDLFNPSTGANQTAYVNNIINDLALKKAAGFNVSFNDYWSRALSYHFLPNTTSDNFFSNSSENHAAQLTFSSITQLPSFTSSNLSFPIVVATVVSPNQKGKIEPDELVPLSNVVYEFTAFEFGSYTPSLASFIPINLLGTAYNNGTAVGECATSFDNSGFVLGSSSCLFASYNETNSLAWDFAASPIHIAWELVNSTFYSSQPNQEIDIAAVPNPFMGISPEKYEDSTQTELRLIDGGLAGAVSPIGTLSLEARNMDLIVVLDAPADSTTNTPLGVSMVISQEQVELASNGTILLPPLPRSNLTFVSQGLNVRPSFFGCNGTAAKLGGVKVTNQTYPFIVYIPNYLPSSNLTNTPTAQLLYTKDAQVSFLENSFEIATRGFPLANATSDPNWPTCLACTTIERVRGREGIDRTPACSACFDRYCWSEVEAASNGTTASSSPGKKSSGERLSVLSAVVLAAIGFVIFA